MSREDGPRQGGDATGRECRRPPTDVDEMEVAA